MEYDHLVRSSSLEEDYELPASLNGSHPYYSRISLIRERLCRVTQDWVTCADAYPLVAPGIDISQRLRRSLSLLRISMEASSPSTEVPQDLVKCMHSALAETFEIQQELVILRFAKSLDFASQPYDDLGAFSRRIEPIQLLFRSMLGSMADTNRIDTEMTRDGLVSFIGTLSESLVPDLGDQDLSGYLQSRFRLSANDLYVVSSWKAGEHIEISRWDAYGMTHAPRRTCLLCQSEKTQCEAGPGDGWRCANCSKHPVEDCPCLFMPL